MNIAMLHYTAPPVVGGVEAVIHAHARTFTRNGLEVTVIAGRGSRTALPEDTAFILMPELDSGHPEVLAISRELEAGQVPASFEPFTARLQDRLQPILAEFDVLIVHNVFSKHFNLPLTAALSRLVGGQSGPQYIAWCHDFTWSSPSSRHKVHPGYPWELLKSQLPGVKYVVVSRQRQEEFAEISGAALKSSVVVYNGVGLAEVLGWSRQGAALAERLGMRRADLVLLMPVRVTQAKNIEFAMRLVAAIKEQGLRPLLVITGPPDPHSETGEDYFDSLRELRRQLGVENEVRFVFESAPDGSEGYLIDTPVVYDLLRGADVMLMPSHREGFGMPVLEAGLAGVPVVVQAAVPAAREIAGEHVLLALDQQSPAEAARQLVSLAGSDGRLVLRRQIRQKYTWQAIFDRQIRGLLGLKGD
jgi:glycosyltransferase involved in cell wall biosynthesis